MEKIFYKGSSGMFLTIREGVIIGATEADSMSSVGKEFDNLIAEADQVLHLGEIGIRGKMEKDNIGRWNVYMVEPDDKDL